MASSSQAIYISCFWRLHNLNGLPNNPYNFWKYQTKITRHGFAIIVRSMPFTSTTEIPKKEMILKGPSCFISSLIKNKSKYSIYMQHKSTGSEADLHSHPY